MCFFLSTQIIINSINDDDDDDNYNKNYNPIGL